MPIDQIITQGGLGFALAVALFWVRDSLKRLDAVTKRLWVVEDQAAKATDLATEVMRTL